MVIRLVENKQLHNFIYRLGFSAGGQFVQHYAVLTSIDNFLVKKDIKITYIPISSSSYLYFDATRPLQYVSLEKRCNNYNQYKYGLENVYKNYSASIGRLLNNYKFKHIIYVVGENDNSRFSIFLDKSCAADIQGLNRRERMLNYYNYLINFYGASVKKYQRAYISKNVDHRFSKELISDLESII